MPLNFVIYIYLYTLCPSKMGMCTHICICISVQLIGHEVSVDRKEGREEITS